MCYKVLLVQFSFSLLFLRLLSSHSLAVDSQPISPLLDASPHLLPLSKPTNCPRYIYARVVVVDVCLQDSDSLCF